MRRRMDREHVLRWKASYDLLNVFQELERTTPSEDERSRKWNVLQMMLQDFDWIHARPTERGDFVRRWKAAVE
jgi:hypothetical protein